MTDKQCISCKENKSIEFYEVRKDTGKIRNTCKQCKSKYIKQYKSDIKNNERQKNVIEVENNKKKCKICGIKKELSHFPLRNTKHGYRHECKTCKNNNLHQYYSETYNEVRRNKKKTDIQYKILCNHRNFIHKCVAKYKMNKSKKSVEYLGISCKELKDWLEYQFDEDMNWKNYGKYWTIDHVLPLSLFDLTNKDEQKIAFSWTNLQPHKDNFSKNNKIRLYEYFNVLISASRYIKNKKMNLNGYQNLSESLNWLRKKLRNGNNSLDEENSSKMGNPQPSS